MGIRLIVLLGLLGIAGSDPSSLVNRLGSPKYIDREEASAAIEKLGRDALPALRSARTGSDAEIRSRASELVERIENELMVRPTLMLMDRFPPRSSSTAAIHSLVQSGFTPVPISSWLASPLESDFSENHPPAEWHNGAHAKTSPTLRSNSCQLGCLQGVFLGRFSTLRASPQDIHILSTPYLRHDPHFQAYGTCFRSAQHQFFTIFTHNGKNPLQIPDCGRQSHA